MMRIIATRGFIHGERYRAGDILELPTITAMALVKNKLAKPYIEKIIEPLEIVCMASGPTLTLKQVDAIRKWRKEADAKDWTGPKRKVIAVNNTYERARWADYLFALDKDWWKHYKAQEKFKGKLYSVHNNLKGVEKAPFDIATVNKVRNSGGVAMMLAKYLGATKIILAGYDLKAGRFGKKHWHKDHPRPLHNITNIEDWPKNFAKVADEFTGIDVVNCSPDTALKLYRLAPLEDELAK